MIIFITGGSSGLGEAITRNLSADNNNTVYFTYFKSEQSAHKIEEDFSNAISLKCNFKSQSEVTELVSRLTGICPDVIINNAYSGTSITSHFHKISSADFLLEFQENVIPTILLTQAAITGFRKNKKGKIITILSSFLVNVPPAGSAIYTSNKAYLKNLSNVWAAENIRYNITSNTVSPSFMLTNFTNNTDDRIIEQLITAHPLKKILLPDEVAEAVHYLTYASSQVNGIDLIINAGASIR